MKQPHLLPLAFGSLFDSAMTESDFEVVNELNIDIVGGQKYYTISAVDHLKIHSVDSLIGESLNVVAVDGEGIRKDVSIAIDGAKENADGDVVWLPCEPLRQRIIHLRLAAEAKAREAIQARMHANLSKAIASINKRPEFEIEIGKNYVLDDGAFMHVTRLDPEHSSGVTMIGGAFVLPGHDSFQLGCIPIHRVVKELKEVDV